MPTPEIIVGNEFHHHSVCQTERVLLLNPPVYDYRLEWAHRHHPLGLEQIGALLAEKGADVKLIDCLASAKQRIPKTKIRALKLDDYEFVLWRFGETDSGLMTALRKLGSWQPDVVMVTTLNSLWWKGAVDAIGVLRKVFSGVQVVLGGMYPTYELDHAVKYSDADILVTGSVPEASNARPECRTWSSVRRSAGIQFYQSQDGGIYSPRPVSDFVAEVDAAVAAGIREIVLFDERISPEDADAFHALLDRLAQANHGISLVAPGNIPPELVDSRMAKMFRPAGVKQVILRCEIDFSTRPIRYTSGLDSYHQCTDLLVSEGGFRERTDQIAAALVVGLPFENLADVCERLIRMAHAVGSVLLVPFQYVPNLHQEEAFRLALSKNGHLNIDEFNSKLFPMARLSGHTLEEYIELVRLGALLNSKYRSKTFDFLGNSFAARMFRESIRTQGWNPFGTGDPVFESMSELDLTTPKGTQNDSA